MNFRVLRLSFCVFSFCFRDLRFYVLSCEIPVLSFEVLFFEFSDLVLGFEILYLSFKIPITKCDTVFF